MLCCYSLLMSSFIHCILSNSNKPILNHPLFLSGSKNQIAVNHHIPSSHSHSCSQSQQKIREREKRKTEDGDFRLKLIKLTKNTGRHTILEHSSQSPLIVIIILSLFSTLSPTLPSSYHSSTISILHHHHHHHPRV